MAKEYDIYLKRHQTECNIIIYSIPYYDGITVADWLVLDAALQDYILKKTIAVQSGIEVTAHINEMIKLCLERASMGVALSSTAEFQSQSKLYLNNDPLILEASIIDVLQQAIIEVKDGLVFDIKPFNIQLAKSLGEVDLPIQIRADLTDILKQSFFRTRAGICFGADIGQFNKLDYITVDSPIIIEPVLRSLSYQLAIEANTGIGLSALVLGTRTPHSLGIWYDGITFDSEVNKTWAQKFITIQSNVEVDVQAIEKLMRVIYPSEITIHFDASILKGSLKRYRLLKEVDIFTLDDIDDMKLETLDYIWLTD